MLSSKDQQATINEALSDPINEPLNWLLGNSLRQYKAWPKYPHLLLGALMSGNSPILEFWNAMIDAFRSLIVNAKDAPDRASSDVNASGNDVNVKLQALATEMLAALELSRRGFTELEFLRAAKEPMPDFLAKIDGREARIEVKSLQEPDDHINSVAGKRWIECRTKDGSRYNFHAQLTHAYYGPLTVAAQSRLRNLIDSFPEMTKPVRETLDGDVEITLKRFDGSESALNAFILARLIGAGEGRLLISSPAGREIFDEDTALKQRLFLKAIRIIVSAQKKFFGQGVSRAETLNFITLGWQPPNMVWSGQMVEEVETAITQFYANFDLSLKVLLFQPTAVWIPPDVLTKYLRPTRDIDVSA